ncbi:MAG: hypothetical protein R2694_06775 [Ilumatobacteraceae bacterium]
MTTTTVYTNDLTDPLVATVPGADMEFSCGSGGGSRADVCRGDEYVEIKPVGADLQGYEELQIFLNDLMRYSGKQGWPAYASDWPAGGQIGVPGTPLSVTYAKSAVFPGVYTWFLSGGTLPSWNEWKVKQREQVRAYEETLTTVSANSGGFNWEPWAWVGTIGVGLWWAGKALSPACGPLMPVCAVAL